MNTRLVNCAADVITRAMENGRQTPAGWAMALESAQLLQSPETAAHLARVEQRRAELETALSTHRQDDQAEIKRLRDRVAELEARIAESERPVDEDPIAFALTNRAVVPAGFCRNESPFGRRCDLTAGHAGDHGMADGRGGHFGWPVSAKGDATPKVRQLQELIARQREQAGDVK